ncbi:deoxycytidine metabolic process [Dermatophagoides farinae]|uniref:Deoxycytidine metabolic process n=1 Tax=Dermatophagoides farinae TaxID=6954 RepID=A0A922I5M5_DERFA|nr:deoxycytidine metabolic process [Dermatophagoides farinae]
MMTIHAIRYSLTTTTIWYKHCKNNVEISKKMSKLICMFNKVRMSSTTANIGYNELMPRKFNDVRVCMEAPPSAQQQQHIHKPIKTVMQCFGAKTHYLLSQTIRKRSFCPLSSVLAAFLRSSSTLHDFSHSNRKKSTLISETMEQFIIKSTQSKNNDEDNNESSLISKTLNDNRLFEIPSMCLSYKAEKNKVLKIIVEGNIGSGKTTFLSIFAKNCSKLCNDPLIIPEPVDLWRDVGGVNIFQLLADDPKRWSFTFQSYVQLTMLKIHELMPENGNVKVMERSLYSARYCFVENLMQKKLISPCEYHVLNQWFNNCLPAAQIDLIIYLRTDPDIVFERIKKRGRPEESKITLDYLRALHKLHEDWLVHKKFSLPAPVLTIDANTPLEDLMAIYEEQTGGILREHQILA